jgi:hypothetical protein
MTCRELGGASDLNFFANTFEEIAEMSKQHGMEMLKRETRLISMQWKK